MEYYKAIEEYYKKAQSRTLHRESYEEWDDMLCVLPPDNWHTDRDGVNKFTMCEFDCGNITTMHARVTIDEVEHYFCKKVNAYDRSTWITIDMIYEFLAIEANCYDPL